MKNLRKFLVFVLFALATVFAFSMNSVKAADTWKLVKDAATLKAGDQIVIVAVDSAYALSTTQNDNNRSQAEIVKKDDEAVITNEVQVLTLEAGTVENTFAFYTGSGYLYAASSSKNHLRTEENLSANSSWGITITDGVATIKAQGDSTRNWMRYNKSSKLFACYGSGQQDIAIYKLNIEEVEAGYAKIDYELNGGNNENDAPTTYEEGQVLTLPIPTKEGNVFLGWYLSSDFSGESITEISAEQTGDVTVYAKWEEEAWYTFSSKVTSASLNYNYSKESIEGEFSATAASNKSSTNLSIEAKDAAKNAEALGLDSSLFAVTATKPNTGNAPGLYSELRLYGHYETSTNCSITVTLLTGTIKSITIDFAASTGAQVNVSGNVVTGTNGIYEINNEAFTIVNTNTDNSQVKINSIDIECNGEAVEYVNQEAQLRFGALLTPELYEKLLEAGATEIGVEMTLNDNTITVAFVDHLGESTFELVDGKYQSAAVIKNIPVENYADEITAKCYVIIDGDTYYMAATTYSVKTIAAAYINAQDISAYEEHINALIALAE